MVRYLFYTIGDLTYQSPLVVVTSQISHILYTSRFQTLFKNLASFTYPVPDECNRGHPIPFLKDTSKILYFTPIYV